VRDQSHMRSDRAALPTDTLEIALLSYPRSGSHLTRFVVELATGRATLGCRTNAQDVPICHNSFRGASDILSHVDVMRPIAQKAHRWEELETYEIGDKRRFGKVVVVVRDPVEAVLAHVGRKATKAKSNAEVVKILGGSAEWWSSIVGQALSDPRVETIVWYEDLALGNDESWRQSVSSILNPCRQSVLPDKEAFILANAVDVRRISSTGENRAWSGVRSLGHEPGFHARRLPDHLRESAVDTIVATVHEQLRPHLDAKADPARQSIRLDVAGRLSRFLDGGQRTRLESRRSKPASPESEADSQPASEANLAPPTFRVKQRGRMANQMFQYMLARSVAAEVPGLQISGLSLPEWSIETKREPAPARNVLRIKGSHWLSPKLARVVEMLNARVCEGAVYSSFGMRLQYYRLPRTEYRTMFGIARPTPGFGDDELVIHIRAGDVLRGGHPHYAPLPLAYYRQIIAETGKRPIFLGQIDEDHPYLRALREAFPAAGFLAPDTPRADFLKLASARHIVLSISSFAWLAGWFSEAETIALPLAGIFNPEQRDDIDLIPRKDPRYRYYAFPRLHWRAQEDQFEALMDLDRYFDRVEPPAAKPKRKRRGAEGESKGMPADG